MRPAAPSVRWLFSIHFWLLLILWSFLPSRAFPLLHWDGLSVDSRDLPLLIAAFVTLFNKRLFRFLGSACSRFWAGLVLFCFYCLVSFLWSTLDTADKYAMGLSLALFAASVTFAYSYTSILSQTDLQAVCLGSTLFVAATGVLYSADSFFTLGLRGAAFAVKEDAFGIVRVGGPLYGSSTGYFVLVPALGFVGDQFLRKGGRKLSYVLAGVALALTLIGLGSRGGLLVAVVFVALALSAVLSPQTLLKVGVFLLILTFSTLALLSSLETTERLYHPEDEGRLKLHAKAFQILKHRSVIENVAGSGYGSVWPWYRLDSAIFRRQYWQQVQTEYGLYTAGQYLYHSHSVFLFAVVELGLPGSLCLFALVGTLWRIYGLSRKLGMWRLGAAGLAASGLGLFLDLFLFYRPRQCLIWWVWLFSLIRLLTEREARPIAWLAVTDYELPGVHAKPPKTSMEYELGAGGS
jgi:O-antigen ligase